MKKSLKLGIVLLVILFVIFLLIRNNKQGKMHTRHVVQEACAVGEYGIAYDKTGEQFNADIMLDAMNNLADATRKVSISSDEIIALMQKECPSNVEKFVSIYEE